MRERNSVREEGIEILEKEKYRDGLTDKVRGERKKGREREIIDKL